jgi:hypothetical protein
LAWRVLSWALLRRWVLSVRFAFLWWIPDPCSNSDPRLLESNRARGLYIPDPFPLPEPIVASGLVRRFNPNKGQVKEEFSTPLRTNYLRKRYVALCAVFEWGGRTSSGQSWILSFSNRGGPLLSLTLLLSVCCRADVVLVTGKPLAPERFCKTKPRYIPKGPGAETNPSWTVQRFSPTGSVRLE